MNDHPAESPGQPLSLLLGPREREKLRELASELGVSEEEAARRAIVDGFENCRENADDSSGGKERRRSPRKRVDYPAVVNAVSGGRTAFSKAFVRDCSLRGVLLQVQLENEEDRQVFAAAEQFEVVFTSPDSRDFIHLDCAPRRVRSNGSLFLAGEVSAPSQHILSKLKRFLAE
jgi:hypothetical protein